MKQNIVSFIKSTNMTQVWLKYYQEILEKVSFSKEIFVKEFNKSLKYLFPSEQRALEHWIQSNYQLQYQWVKSN